MKSKIVQVRVALRSHAFVLVVLLLLLLQLSCAGQPASQLGDSSEGQALELTDEQGRCRALHRARDLTIIYAEVLQADDQAPDHCYAKGIIDGSITFHVQLPLPQAWNGRLVHLGDGGADGDLDSQNEWLGRGYAVANSNTGHDTGAVRDTYAFHDERANENFAHRAVHLTATASKSAVFHYYGSAHEYAYHVGCSTGGRQALAAAQLYPYDFDGIVAGAPAHRQFERMAHRLDVVQHLYEDDFAGNLAFDADGDGWQEDLTSVELLAQRVIEKCDALDGIEDGIVEPPLCDFVPRRDLAADICESEPGKGCFTEAQLAAIEHLYEGSRDSAGRLVYPGAPLGSELAWQRVFVPHVGNNFVPYVLRSASAVIAYSFYRDDPGLMPPDLADVGYLLDRDAQIPEWGWWDFDIDDVQAMGSERTSAVSTIMRGNDPDLERFFKRNGGKLLMYHGWSDAVIPPEPSLEYRASVVEAVFGGDEQAASDHLRLFMAPGVGHCRGGVGPDRVDYLAALAAWVEEDIAPDSLLARHITDGVVDNERPLCVYPARAVYVGPEGGEHDQGNWVATNFECR